MLCSGALHAGSLAPQDLPDRDWPSEPGGGPAPPRFAHSQAGKTVGLGRKRTTKGASRRTRIGPSSLKGAVKVWRQGNTRYRPLHAPRQTGRPRRETFPLLPLLPLLPLMGDGQDRCRDWLQPPAPLEDGVTVPRMSPLSSSKRRPMRGGRFAKSIDSMLPRPKGGTRGGPPSGHAGGQNPTAGAPVRSGKLRKALITPSAEGARNDLPMAHPGRRRCSAGVRPRRALTVRWVIHGRTARLLVRITGERTSQEECRGGH